MGESPNVISLTDEPLNAFIPIFLSLLGNDNVESALQPANASSSIISMFSLNAKDERAAHDSKHFFGTEETAAGKANDFNCEHPENAPSESWLRLFPISILDSDQQSLNAYCFICVTPVMLIDCNDEQPLNA